MAEARVPPVRRARTRTSTLGVWFLVAIPTLLVLTCAILILVYQQSAFDVAMGVLLVCFCLAIGAGAALTIMGLRADRRLAGLQLDFVSKVSHELKTPLTSIRMFVDTLRLGRVKDADKVERCLEVISKETDRLSGLIGRLLSWGAMESGAFRVFLEPKRPEEIVENALKVFEAQAMSAGLDLALEVAPNLPAIQADESALTDAILNLLTNAQRYGGESKQIWVSVKRRGDDQVGIAVRDRGIGIEPRHHKKIFERFYRADERYSRAAGGTGLGLAITRHIVVAHGGSIELDSQPGLGSTFTIVLPAGTAMQPVATEGAA